MKTICGICGAIEIDGYCQGNNWILHPFKSWRARLRRIDLDILWPEVKWAAEGDILKAREGFLVYICCSRHWIKDLLYKEMVDIIEKLE